MSAPSAWASRRFAASASFGSSARLSGQYAFGPEPEDTIIAGRGVHATAARAARVPSHSAHSTRTSLIASLVPARRDRGVQPSLGDRVRDAFFDQFITNGAVPAGGRLPTETELCQRYEVSRITVRAALRSLQDAGFVSTRQGQGTTVLPRSDTIASGLDHLCSFETYAREDGRDVETALIDIEELEAVSDIAHRLDVPLGSPILVVRRAKLYGGAPIGWIVDYVRTAFCPSPPSSQTSQARCSMSCSSTPSSKLTMRTATSSPSCLIAN